MQLLKVTREQRSGAVHTIEAGHVEGPQGGIAGAYGGHQIRDGLIHDPISTNCAGDLLFIAVEGDELGAGGHVDAVHVGEADGRRGRGKVDRGCAGGAEYLYNVTRGGSANNRIVNQEDRLRN